MKLFSVLCALILSSAACAGTDGSDITASNDFTDDAVEAMKIGCGGVAQVACPSGYACAAAAHSSDGSGTCKKNKKCVQKSACAQTAHWDAVACQCIGNVTCMMVRCSSGFHCEDQPISGGTQASCVHD